MADKRRAVFLDRDGTINVEKNYLHKIADFEFIPGVPEAIKRLKDAGFLVIVVSNQAGIARGYFDEAAVEKAVVRVLAYRGYPAPRSGAKWARSVTDCTSSASSL